MIVPPQVKAVLSGAAGALGGTVMCVLPVTLGYGDPGRQTWNWLLFGWPGVWLFCAVGAGLITIPLTLVVFALWGPRYSGAAPLARQARKRAEEIHPQPDHDREMGLLAGGLGGAITCAAVPPMLASWSAATPQAAFRGNALADLLVTGSLVAGVIAKLAYLELQMRNPTY